MMFMRESSEVYTDDLVAYAEWCNSTGHEIEYATLYPDVTGLEYIAQCHAGDWVHQMSDFSGLVEEECDPAQRARIEAYLNSIRGRIVFHPVTMAWSIHKASENRIIAAEDVILQTLAIIYHERGHALQRHHDILQYADASAIVAGNYDLYSNNPLELDADAYSRDCLLGICEHLDWYLDTVLEFADLWKAWDQQN